MPDKLHNYLDKFIATVNNNMKVALIKIFQVIAWLNLIEKQFEI